MPGRRLFIDSASKLFIALTQINIDTFYRHLFIVTERELCMTFYEELVIELTTGRFPIRQPIAAVARPTT